MLICTTYLPQCSVSLRFMEPGDGLIWRFTNLYAMIEDRPIDIYNNGEMYRDFTYVEDLVRGIRL